MHIKKRNIAGGCTKNIIKKRFNYDFLIFIETNFVIRNSFSIFAERKKTAPYIIALKINETTI